MVDFAITNEPEPSQDSPGTQARTDTTITTTVAPAASATQADESKPEPTRREVAYGVLALGLWTSVLAIGIVFPSDPIRDTLRNNVTTAPAWRSLLALACFLMCYTVTNVAILCGISSWLGELGRRTRIDGTSESQVFRRGDYIAAVMRGFLAYLAILTGFVVVGTGVNLFVNPSADGYVRLAAVVSLAGYLVGSNPALFRRFESNFVGQVITERLPDGTTKRTVTAPATIRETSSTEQDSAGPAAGRHEVNRLSRVIAPNGE